jgi:hypothetical protein
MGRQMSGVNFCQKNDNHTFAETSGSLTHTLDAVPDRSSRRRCGRRIEPVLRGTESQILVHA